ncbi:ArnT family glycosyltransferase [Nakamurella sp. GG22]
MTATAHPRDDPDERQDEQQKERQPGRHHSPERPTRPLPMMLGGWLRTALPVFLVLAFAGLFRFWDLDGIGFNSDEAVYTGTAASIDGNPSFTSIFPIFRAHPVLFQMLLSLFLRDDVSDLTARAVPAVIGVLTVAVTYVLGRRMYGHRTGLIAALLLAVMTYHVVVTRQVLLDGLMTLFATGVLYCVVRYSESAALRWLVATGALLGATILAKENSVILVGALYCFFALTPSIRLHFRHLLIAALTTVGIVLAFPLALTLSGTTGTGQNYLLWQLFRPANHPLPFYFTVLPAALGFLVLAVAFAGLVWLRHENTWRERLLMCWLVVPVAFFTVWPVKGYQYLLPIAPVVALMAGRTLARLGTAGNLAIRPKAGLGVTIAATALVVVSAVIPTWNQITSPPQGTFLAGTGGVAGGREAGLWLQDNVPEGAKLMTIGPSMANILQFYGHHTSFALSVSPNPQSRNPSYTPIVNPDLAVRSGDIHYLVWDAYTAARTPFFAAKLQTLVARYNGTPVFTASTPDDETSGAGPTPLVIVYQVTAP